MMKDQYNMDQYIKETSQIHAPADLIRRTKEAVREEEQRVQKETAVQTEQNVMAYAPKNVSAGTDNIHGKVYKWALPVAAAAVCVLLLNIFAMRLGGNGTKSQSDTAMDTTAGGQTDNSMEMYLAEAGTANEAETKSSDAVVDRIAEAAEDNGAFIGNEALADSDSSESDEFDAQEYKEKFEVTEDYLDESIAEESGSGANDRMVLTVNEAEGIPDFVQDNNTQCITSHGLQFYVTREWENRRTAYVCVNEVGYVITGDVEGTMDEESFVEKAYEYLIETVGGID